MGGPQVWLLHDLPPPKKNASLDPPVKFSQTREPSKKSKVLNGYTGHFGKENKDMLRHNILSAHYKKNSKCNTSSGI